MQLIALIQNQLTDVTSNETMRFKLTFAKPLTQIKERFLHQLLTFVRFQAFFLAPIVLLS